MANLSTFRKIHFSKKNRRSMSKVLKLALLFFVNFFCNFCHISSYRVDNRILPVLCLFDCYGIMRHSGQLNNVTGVRGHDNLIIQLRIKVDTNLLGLMILTYGLYFTRTYPMV